MYQSLIMVDEFYPDPMEVRRLALASEYPAVTTRRTFPGRNSAQRYIPPGLDDVISRLVGEPLVGNTESNAGHGCFRITLAGEPSRYLVHVDPPRLSWVGVIYLNLPEQCRGGTSFFRHKGLNSDRTPLSEAELRAYGPASMPELMQQDGNDPAKWEHLMTVPMRFNRLILYRPWLWHSSGESFGTTVEDGRLIQLVAFYSAHRG